MATRLLIAICTYRRPEQLKRCLASILDQLPGQEQPVRLAVVDNDEARSAHAVAAELSAASGHEILYAVEPAVGIPYARNHAVELCLETGAGWLVFIDDDAMAAPGWLEGLFWAIGQYAADVIAGPVEKPLPEPAPFWALPRPVRSPGEGAPLNVARTNNVAIRSDVLRARPDLRFDTAMRFSGGSDTDFFRRLNAMGGTLRWSDRPRVIEPVPRSRLTFRWQIGRKFRTACNTVHVYRKLRPAAGLYVNRGSTALWRLISGAVVLAGSAVLLPLWPSRFKKPVLRGAQDVFWAFGTLAALAGYSPQPYRPDRIGGPDVQGPA